MSKNYCISFIVLYIFISSCTPYAEHTGDSKAAPKATNTPSLITNIDYTFKDATQISPDIISKIKDKKILLFHASVGGDIIDGLKDLAKENPQSFNLNFVKQSSVNSISKTWQTIEGGVFGDYYMGTNNGYAQNKLNFFETTLTTNHPEKDIDIVIFKFCYMEGYLKNLIKTPEELFSATKAKYEELEKLFPKTTFVWATMPIILDCRTKHYAYNQLVREYCQTKGKFLFDIANIESHNDNDVYNYEDGCEKMVPEYTRDSGHLNTTGRQKAANALWYLLAEVVKIK